MSYLLGAFAVAVLGALGFQSLRVVERIYRLRAASEAHHKAQAALESRVEALAKEVKSVANVVASGSAWK